MMNPVIYSMAKFQSNEKKEMVKLIDMCYSVVAKEKCNAIFAWNNDCFCIYDKNTETIEIGNSKKSLHVHTEHFKSIFDVCKEMQQDIKSIGFTFNNLKLYPETTESASKKKDAWLADFAF